MLSNHLILSRPRLLLPSVSPSIRVFSIEPALHIRWPKDWSFSFSISPSNGLPCWLMVKRLPAMRKTRVRSLGPEDPLEKEMATHSSILTWKIPWTEEPGRLQSMGSQRAGRDWAILLSLSNEYSGLISFRIDCFDILAALRFHQKTQDLPPALKELTVCCSDDQKC